MSKGGMMSINDNLDYISLRVCTSGFLGFASGSLISLYRGYDSIVRTSSRTALSCALVSTACFTLERCTYIGITQYLLNDEERYDFYHNTKKLYYLKLYTHMVGGMLGGAYVGGLYTGKLLRGSFVLTPIMVLIAMTEDKVQQEIRNYINDPQNNTSSNHNNDTTSTGSTEIHPQQQPESLSPK